MPDLGDVVDGGDGEGERPEERGGGLVGVPGGAGGKTLHERRAPVGRAFRAETGAGWRYGSRRRERATGAVPACQTETGIARARLQDAVVRTPTTVLVCGPSPAFATVLRLAGPTKAPPCGNDASVLPASPGAFLLVQSRRTGR